MTPKEKARQLIEKYHDEFGMLWYLAKQCALIAVNEILNIVSTVKSEQYWQSVKQEIKKL